MEHIKKEVKKKQCGLDNSKKNRLTKGFTKIPNKVLIPNGLNGYEKMVYCVLLMYAMTKGECYPAKPTIANATGFNIKTINKALNVLEEKKHIIIKREKGKINYYKILKT